MVLTIRNKTGTPARLRIVRMGSDDLHNVAAIAQTSRERP
jgi:hypothetical protein